MPPHGSLELYRDEISALFCLGHTPHDIRKILASQRIRVTNHTIQRSIKSWGVEQSLRVYDEERNLVQRIVDKHFRSGRHRKLAKRDSHSTSFVTSSDGPNHVWVLVPYRGLERFGIQISVAIDDYSNENLWVEVGVDASSGDSICRQYLDYVSGRLFQPEVLQTDFWGLSEETENVADAHYLLRRAGPGREYMFLENIQPPALEDCLRSGSGSGDDRMQIWHNKFTKSYATSWIRHFSCLEHEGLFSAESELDKVALLAVYLPIIQREVQTYAEAGGCIGPHISIGRLQRQTRNYSNSGRCTLDKRVAKDHQLQVDHILLEDLRRDLVHRKEDEYLPSHTLKWCQAKLRDIGFDPLDPPSWSTENEKNPVSKPYRDVYLILRQEVYEYERTGEFPRLSLNRKKEL